MKKKNRTNYYQLIMAVLLGTMSMALNAQPLTLEVKDGWKFKQVDSVDWYPAIVPGSVHTDLLANKLIEDPFYRLNERKLQWIDKADWVYETTFILPPDLISKENIELDFKGLDTYADVYLNDKKILTADNMFRGWLVDIKSTALKGKNTLRIYFHSPVNKGLELLKAFGFNLKASNDQAVNGGLTKDQLVSPFIRKAPYHFGWDWGPRFVTSGIWHPVFVRAWNDVKIEDLYVEQQSLTDQLAKLNGQITVQSTKDQKAEVEIVVNGKSNLKKSFLLHAGNNTLDLPFNIEYPERWWSNGLGKPTLYSISATVNTGKSSDTQNREIGLRTLKLIQKKDSAGHSFYFELNGVPVFAKGENHIPNDMFLNRVTHDVYDWEIQTAVKSNLNMLRVWGGGIYEDDYFYQLCDRNGILIWQDFMFACSLYPGNEAFLNSVTQEADYQVKRLRNHPCMALWCGNNEIDVAWQNENKTAGWGWQKTYDTEQRAQIWAAYDTIFNHILANAVKTLSPSIAYWQSSPSSILPGQYSSDTNMDGDVHYWGVWHGKEPFENYAKNIGRFMSEYGFQSFPELESVRKYALPADYDIESEVMRSHQRSGIGNVTIRDYMNKYYRIPLDFAKFLYVGQVLQAYGIKFAIESHRRAMPLNMGSLVWQINDCWPVASWSSSDYYHRWKALQYEIKRSFEPVIISAYSSGENTCVTVVTDKLTDSKAVLELQVLDFNGRILLTRSIPVDVKANGVTAVLTSKTNDLTANEGGTFLTMTLKTNGVLMAQKNYYFTQPKNLNLLKPVISTHIEKQASTWVIRLKSDVLAKDVYLNFPGVEGFFNDNYIDLLPGKETVVTFTPTNSTQSPGKLELMSLVDSY